MVALTIRVSCQECGVMAQLPGGTHVSPVLSRGNPRTELQGQRTITAGESALHSAHRALPSLPQCSTGPSLASSFFSVEVVAAGKLLFKLLLFISKELTDPFVSQPKYLREKIVTLEFLLCADTRPVMRIS